MQSCDAAAKGEDDIEVEVAGGVEAVLSFIVIVLIVSVTVASSNTVLVSTQGYRPAWELQKSVAEGHNPSGTIATY